MNPSLDSRFRGNDRREKEANSDNETQGAAGAKLYAITNSRRRFFEATSPPRLNV